jgi:hypothetical protein
LLALFSLKASVCPKDWTHYLPDRRKHGEDQADSFKCRHCK